MKNRALIPVLAGLGLGLVITPSHAQGLVFNPTAILPNFSTTLTDFSGSAPVNINATDANTAGNYLAGLFGFDGTEFQVENLTQNTGDVGFPDPTALTPELSFTNLLLTENFTSGPAKTLSLFDVGDTTFSTPLTSVDGGGIFLQSAPTGTLPGNLVSATLTGVYSDGSTPAGQPVPVEVSAVPEPATDALLLLGLLPAAALSLRARKARRA